MIWKVVAYLVLIICVLLAGLAAIALNGLVPQLKQAEPVISAAMIGGIGGCLYCLRAVYLNACIKQQWQSDWLPWYYIRPITSVISGGASYVFLYAGLLVLDARPAAETSHFGFYALAFVAGLNVDRFLSKIEDIARTTWGIEKSRTSQNSDADRGHG